MFTKKFLIDTAERVLFTMAEAAAGVFSVDKISAFDIDWKYLAGISLAAGFYTLVKAVIAQRSGDPDTAGFVK